MSLSEVQIKSNNKTNKNFTNSLTDRNLLFEKGLVSINETGPGTGIPEPKDTIPQEYESNQYDLILAESPVYFNGETDMTENSCRTPAHIRIPRSLLDDPLWENLRLKHQKVFETILANVRWTPCLFDDGGEIIKIEPGQFCTSIRDLQKICHKEISKNDIEGAIKKLISCEFLRQEVRHFKTVLTITHKDTYDLIILAGQTASQTVLRQYSDTKEESNKEISLNLSSSLHSEEEIPSRQKKVQRAADKLKFNFDKGQFEGIDPDDVKAWSEVFPTLNILHEIRHAALKISSDRPKYGRFRTWRKYLVNIWFPMALKIQKNASQRYPEKDRSTKNPDGTPVDNPLKGMF